MMNRYLVIKSRFVNNEVGNLLESLPAIKADYFLVEESKADLGVVMAKFWRKGEDDHDHELVAVVSDFDVVVLIDTPEEDDSDESHPLGERFATT